MAISSAVHPVRVEKVDADQKIVKTVTIADPPIIERSTRCSHIQKPNSSCAKCGALSSDQSQDKKSILINKEHSEIDSNKKHSDGPPRRHSDDHAILVASKHGNKQTNSFTYTGSGKLSSKSVKNTSTIMNTNKKSAQATIQRSSSLKNPARKSLMQVNMKITKDGNSNKQQSRETYGGNQTGNSVQKKATSNPKRISKSPITNHTKLPTKPSKKMCQPHRILRRSLTLPPFDDQLINPEVRIDTSTNGAHVGTNKGGKLVSSQTTELPNKDSGINFPNLLERRKSYESLDVIDGRTMAPVNTTARQRLLKEYMPRRRFSQGAIKPIREMLLEIEEEENRQIELEKEELKQKRRDQQKKTAKKKPKKKNDKKAKRTINKNPKTKIKIQKQAGILMEEDDDSLCNTDEDFLDLSREEQMERLKEGESRSTEILEEQSRDREKIFGPFCCTNICLFIIILCS